MNRIDKKSPFKVPKNYFDHFDKRLNQKIKTKNSTNGLITPHGYFMKVESEILNKIVYPPQKNQAYKKHLWKIITAAAAVVAIFYLNKNIFTAPENQLAEFFIEDYLTYNNTYEIADYSDYYFETDNFLENYESIAIDDVLELRLYGETPTNLNLFDDE